MPRKFSELVATEKTSAAKVESARADLDFAQSTDQANRQAVVGALQAKGGTVALAMPNGDIEVYTVVNVNGQNTYTVNVIPGDVIPGDFDVPDESPAPNPMPGPEPTPSPEPGPGPEPTPAPQ